MATKLRRLSRLLKPPSPTSHSSSSSYKSCSYLQVASRTVSTFENSHTQLHYIASKGFCSQPLNQDEAHVPSAIDYRSVLQEDEFHRLADSTIHDLQEKLEEYGDTVQVDGFDIDYGNEVLTLKLGELGTYVLNKQTPNRQLWLSSPVSHKMLEETIFTCWAHVFASFKSHSSLVSSYCENPNNWSFQVRLGQDCSSLGL